MLEAITEEEADQEGGWVPEAYDGPTGRHKRLEEKNKAAIKGFLGGGRRANAVVLFPSYYGDLLTWALQRHIEREGWQVLRTLGYHSSEPAYTDVSTDCDTKENLLMEGQLLLEKGDSRLIVTVELYWRHRNSVRAEGVARNKAEVERLIEGVQTIAWEENFYRGKNIEFTGHPRFLSLSPRSWEGIVVDSSTKEEVRANTVGFLRRRELWEKCGMPLKRGVLLGGDPGTGKTIVCKAIIAEAEGVTCITTNAYCLTADEYVTDLYEMAQDLSPCIVFIEDIDLIGQNREEYGYQRGPALLSLLAVLDGVEERQGIVTVATTNSLTVLDKALSQRPSRLDCVIEIPRPTLEQRKQVVGLLCRKIVVDEATQEYIAHKAEGCTPAQLQEVVYSLAIQHSREAPGGKALEGQPPCLEVSKEDVDAVISRVTRRNRHRIGFDVPGKHNGHRAGYVEAWSDDRQAPLEIEWGGTV